MSDMNYYLKDGSLCTMKEWTKLYSDPEYKRIKETVLPSGLWVSTVWLGTNHNFSREGPILIFETMVFPRKCPHNPKHILAIECDCFSEKDYRRYSTEESALQGHKEMCEKWRRIEAGKSLKEPEKEKAK